MRTQWPLVGRTEELELVVEILRDGGSVVLAGEAGVGKSRLASEAAAAILDPAPVRIVATRAAGTIPLGAFAHVLEPAGESGAEARTEMLRRAGEAVAAHAGASAGLLLVDDAHLLDDASAALVLQLVTARRCRVLATVRSGEPSPDPIVALWKDGLSGRVEIQNLSREETTALLAKALDGHVDGATALGIWEATRGNPLFIREIVLAAADADALREDGGIWRLHGSAPLGPRLAEMIGDRLAGLGEDATRAAEALAVADTLGLSVLESVAGARAIEALERRGIVQVSASNRRRDVRFAHPLHGEVLRERMPETTRRTLRARLARAVQDAGARRREDTLRVATWLLDAGASGEDAALLERAADAAHSLFDFDLTERLARAAIDAGAGMSAGISLGISLTERGLEAEADAVFAMLDPGEDQVDRAALATARAFNLGLRMGRFDESVALLEQARSACVDDYPAAWLSAQIGMHRLYAGDAQRAAASLVPLSSRDDRVGVAAAQNGAIALALVGRLGEALTLARRGVEIHRANEGVGQFPEVHLFAAALAASESGDLAAATAAATQGYEAALAARSAEGQSTFLLALGRADLLAGRVRGAGRRFREGVVIARELNDRPALRWHLGGIALSAASVGDLGAAREAAAELARGRAEALLEHDLVARGLAWTAAACGEHSRAREILAEAAAAAAGAGQATVALLALHDGARLGDPVSAADALGAAAAVEGPLAAARAAFVEAIGTGDAEALEAAAAAFGEAGAVLLAAEAWGAASRAHRANGLGRRAAAAAARTSAALAECEGALTPLTRPEQATVVPLTAREREVAELAARGLSSREIAERLFVSVRTVDNHLQQAFRKLGVSSRADLPGALGLAGPAV